MNDIKTALVSKRINTLRSLKAKLDQAKKRIAFIEKRIEEKGINSRFSINEDLLEISQKIWMHCNHLSLLKKTHEDLDDR